MVTLIALVVAEPPAAKDNKSSETKDKRGAVSYGTTSDYSSAQIGYPAAASHAALSYPSKFFINPFFKQFFNINSPGIGAASPLLLSGASLGQLGGYGGYSGLSHGYSGLSHGYSGLGQAYSGLSLGGYGGLSGLSGLSGLHGLHGLQAPVSLAGLGLSHGLGHGYSQGISYNAHPLLLSQGLGSLGGK